MAYTEPFNRHFNSLIWMEQLLKKVCQHSLIKKIKFIAMTLVKVNNPMSKNFDGLVNEFFNDFPATFGKTIREDVFGFPPVNIRENAEAYQLEVAAPGLEKSDFNLNLDKNILTISTEKKEEVKEENSKFIRREFSHKAFKRSFTVDDKIDATNISAKYENGILKVALPKKEEVKVAPKEITVS